MALFVIDFDHTLVDGHTHNTIARAILCQVVASDNEEAQWDLVKGMTALGGSDKWKAVFQSLFDNGHDVAIASFNSYPHVISRFLREKIGLSDHQISRIFINSWLPKNARAADKNEHIEQIINHFYPRFGERPRRDHVILIDDSENNILAAQIAEFQAIQVKNDLAFFAPLNQLITELKMDVPQAVSNAPQFATPGLKR
jgi:hypothetical protein